MTYSVASVEFPYLQRDAMLCFPNEASNHSPQSVVDPHLDLS